MAGRLHNSRDDDLDEMHEINVTPFIDVMLVLLIIFMVAAPLATVDVPVDLPAAAAATAQRPPDPLFVTVKRDLSLTLGDSRLSRASLGAALDQRTKGDKNTRIFVRADKAVAYGALMDVMNLLRRAGYLKIALVGLDNGAPAPGSIK